MDKGFGEIQPQIGKQVVQEHLAILNEFKAPGPDQLHPKVLKELADVISEPLAIIFESSWRTGEVPEDWRRANLQDLSSRREKKRTQTITIRSASCRYQAFSNDEEALINKELPKELLLRIFSFLDIITLCRCAQVSKAWHILALDGSNWQRIDLFNFQTDVEGRVLENISKRCGGFLRQLSLRGCLGVGDSSLKTFAQNCRNIEHLILNGCTKITDSTCYSIGKCCSRLKHLDLTSCVFITNNSLKSLSEGCQNLELLNLSWCGQITKDGIEALVKGCNGLKALFLKGCTQLVDEALHHIENHCHQLVILNLQSCTQISDDGVVGICRGCHQLQSLCVSGCTNLTDVSLIALGLNCPRLK
ncbi:F-box/LRR-repeat protein 2 isoform X4 [Anolis carolinensis]